MRKSYQSRSRGRPPNKIGGGQKRRIEGGFTTERNLHISPETRHYLTKTGHIRVVGKKWTVGKKIEKGSLPKQEALKVILTENRGWVKPIRKRIREGGQVTGFERKLLEEFKVTRRIKRLTERMDELNQQIAEQKWRWQRAIVDGNPKSIQTEWEKLVKLQGKLTERVEEKKSPFNRPGATRGRFD